MKADLRHNVIAVLADATTFGMSLGFIAFDTLLPILAFTLTGNQALVGLLGTLWVGAWLLPQLAFGRWMSDRPRKKPVLVIGAAISRSAWLLLVGLLALGHTLDRNTVYVGLAVFIVVFRSIDALASVAWLDIITRMLPMRVRGQVFGLGQGLANLLRFGASLIVTASIASGLVYPDTFAALYGLAGVLLLFGLVFGLMRFREPADEHLAQASTHLGVLRHVWSVLREDSRFRTMAIARLLLGSFDLARPQYALHATVELGLPDASIGLFTVTQTIGAVVGSLALGRLSERRDPSAVVRVTVALGACVPLFALLLHATGHHQSTLATIGYVTLYALIGALDASFLLGFLAYVLDIAPPGQRPAYTGLANTIAGTIVIAPTIGGIILQLTSYPVLFVCAAAGALASIGVTRRLPPIIPVTEEVA